MEIGLASHHYGTKIIIADVLIRSVKKPEMQSRISPGYEGTESIFYFFYKVI